MNDTSNNMRVGVPMDIEGKILLHTPCEATQQGLKYFTCNIEAAGRCTFLSTCTIKM